MLSYQGSTESTSEGIEQIFDRAKEYHDRNPDVIPVVLLDEVGLAEVSPHNPLKVLHALIEPDSRCAELLSARQVSDSFVASACSPIAKPIALLSASNLGLQARVCDCWNRWRCQS